MKLERSYYTVHEVMQICGIGRSKAYETIRELNKELERKGYLTFQGRVNKAYFNSRIGGNNE